VDTVESIHVRSYRSVFELERRLYRIDRLRLNPAGVPVRSFVYLAVIAIALATIERIPVLGVALGQLPWYLRYGGLAGLMTALLTIVKVDGRTSHLAALSLCRMLLAPRRLWQMSSARGYGQRWEPPDVLFVPDGSQGGAARLRYRGPGAVLVLAPHRCRVRPQGRSLRLLATKDGPDRVTPRVLAVGRRAIVAVDGKAETRS